MSLLKLPATLREWRALEDSVPIWTSLAPFFAQQGYRLFVPLGSAHTAPPGCCPHRAPDDWHHWPPLERTNNAIPHSAFRPTSPVNFAARSMDDKDVIIRLVQLAGDGAEFLDILRFLSSPAAHVPANRTVPMLSEIQKDNMVFGVFPFMSPGGLTNKWCETTRELLDGLEQVFDTFNFLHDNLIAHRDFSLSEVFLNYGSARQYPPDESWFYPQLPGPFRKLFDAQYFINDFELSVHYSPSSDPTSRRVVGHPTARYGHSIDTYGKALPPEALLDEPYCPFRADIFQLGQEILYEFGYVTTLPGLVPLAERMTAADPAQRPSIAEALASLREIGASTPESLLNEMPKDAHMRYAWSLEEIEQRTLELDMEYNATLMEPSSPVPREATLIPEKAVAAGLALPSFTLDQAVLPP
ncbi:hypothetical protein EXIGLDRAFT_829973 [Exidia glandulosa HHB12029]|uniref:Protein kinase domain-containing protein n=1 Tax=Exidia glandulosa HHB12029 TaxID=1314781 RepID=A0A165P138_EXIGL|nr:hypothetical protein EXIGLDRAFT_829973 [Exidia glandulosa HHB12029]